GDLLDQSASRPVDFVEQRHTLQVSGVFVRKPIGEATALGERAAQRRPERRALLSRILESRTLGRWSMHPGAEEQDAAPIPNHLGDLPDDTTRITVRRHATLASLQESRGYCPRQRRRARLGDERL